MGNTDCSASSARSIDRWPQEKLNSHLDYDAWTPAALPDQGLPEEAFKITIYIIWVKCPLCNIKVALLLDKKSCQALTLFTTGPILVHLSTTRSKALLGYGTDCLGFNATLQRWQCPSACSWSCATWCSTRNKHGQARVNLVTWP